MIDLVQKLLKPFKSAMIVMEGNNYTTVSFITKVTKAIHTELTEVSNSSVAPETATSVKNLEIRLIKYFRLQWLGNKESLLYVKLNVYVAGSNLGFLQFFPWLLI